jgi:8-oxo-dGTP pyrophosphatase MutT (NUDIX family)
MVDRSRVMVGENRVMDDQNDERLADLMAAIEAIEPVDDREASSIHRILTEGPKLLRPFDEESDPVHITASAFVVGQRGTVLHLHRKLGIWVQPGGHVDGAERPLEAALRETREETGLTVISAEPDGLLFHVDVHQGPRGHTHLDLRFIVLADASDPSPPPEESQEVRWCTFAEASVLAEPALVPALAKLESTWLANKVAWRAKVEAMDDFNEDPTS